MNQKDILNKYRLLCELMDNIPDVIYFKDKNGRLVYVNRSHAKGLGLKPEQVVGKTDFDFFPKERATRMAKDDEYVLKRGKAIIDKIERSTRADGVDNYVSTTKIPRFDKNGKVIGLIGITRDITRRKIFEQIDEEKNALLKKLKSAQELAKLKSEFISVVSHELRTPLTIVKEAVAIIFDGLAGPINNRQTEFLTKARNNVERLKEMIEQLLDVSRIEMDRVKLHYSLINLNDLIKDSSDFFIKQAQDKRIKLEYNLPARDINIFMDAERINQVISNLITNALKFTEEGGKVKVEAEVLEDKIRVGVIDTGIGIAKQDIAKLFAKFVQVARLPGYERKGLGLGLSIAKELIERHGGEVWAESKSGIGSRFYFTLPRFYTANILNKEVKNRINSILGTKVNVHLINLFIINYRQIRSTMRVDLKKLFDNFKDIIEDVAQSSLRLKEPPLIMPDVHYGECSIILEGPANKNVARFCGILKERLNSYFVKNDMGGTLITLGVLSYPLESPISIKESMPANLYIKEIRIGSDRRLYKRLNYRLVVVIVAGKSHHQARTLDISQRGISFVCKSALKTDAVVDIRLMMGREKVPVCFKGRITWIKKQEVSGGEDAYKVGLEFVNLKNSESKKMKKFVKTITAKA